MITAKFKHDKSGWRCIACWETFTKFRPQVINNLRRFSVGNRVVQFLDKTLIMNVSKPVKRGFSKRPHYYI